MGSKTLGFFHQPQCRGAKVEREGPQLAQSSIVNGRLEPRVDNVKISLQWWMERECGFT